MDYILIEQSGVVPTSLTLPSVNFKHGSRSIDLTDRARKHTPAQCKCHTDSSCRAVKRNGPGESPLLSRRGGSGNRNAAPRRNSVANWRNWFERNRFNAREISAFFYIIDCARLSTEYRVIFNLLNGTVACMHRPRFHLTVSEYRATPLLFFSFHFCAHLGEIGATTFSPSPSFFLLPSSPFPTEKRVSYDYIIFYLS